MMIAVREKKERVLDNVELTMIVLAVIVAAAVIFWPA
jgi:hypothetical protein